jgi:hypothetical protein
MHCYDRKRISTSTSQSQGEREGGWPEGQDQNHSPAAKQQKRTNKQTKKQAGRQVRHMRKATAFELSVLFFSITLELDYYRISYTSIKFIKSKGAGLLPKAFNSIYIYSCFFCLSFNHLGNPLFCLVFFSTAKAEFSI